MRVKKIWLLSKATGEGFLLGAGIVGIVFGIVIVFVSVPLIVIFPIAGVIGIIFAIAAAYYSLQSLNKKESHHKNKKIHHDALFASDIKQDLPHIKKELSKRRVLYQDPSSTTMLFNAILPSLDASSQIANHDFDIQNMLKKFVVINDTEFSQESSCSQDKTNCKKNPSDHSPGF